MGFELVIAEGKEAGREFVFDQASVVIGRTSECDVVLYDPGVSRQHARIFGEGSGYFVEDMGSSNGTKVNGTIIKKKQLADGDAISLGPVVFNFSTVALEAEVTTDHGQNPAPEEHTRVLAASELKRSRNKGVAAVPEGVTADQLKGLARSSTRTLQAVTRPRASSPPLELSRPRPSSPAHPVPRPSAAAAVQISAAEKARLRRQSGGAVGSLRIFWAQASGPVRLAITLVTLLTVGGGATAGIWQLMPEKSGPTGPEPDALSQTPLEDSFGLGTEQDPVQWKRADAKQFEFAFTSPVRAVVMIHFQSRDIAAGEVIISVNAADVGQVPPETNERSNEVLVPSSVLKKGEKNTVTFDNTKNPPGKELWRIWNLWIEVALLPELPDDQLRMEANNRFKKGEEVFERRDVGAPNRWEAYKAFREAWLMLEAHPEPKPSTYHLAREKMREAQGELDRQCSKLLLGAQGAYNQRQFDSARLELDHISEFFPERKHICPLRADQMREAWGL